MSLGLSTSWRAAYHENGFDLVSEIRNLGFKNLELSFNLTPKIVSDIEELVSKGEISVLSVHNFCPIPDGVPRKEALPDYYSLSALDEGERVCAIKQTKKTIDTVSRLNAKAAVLHTGRVEVPDRTRKLIGLYDKGLKETEEFKDLREGIIQERQAKIKPFFENILSSLEELVAYAAKRNIYLGIETRFYYREIPALDEIGIILDKFKGAKLFYWHDVGHAQVMENLGFSRHKDFLERYSSRMGGIHLHNVSGCLDHNSPVKGEIDFREIKKYIKKDTLKIIEAHHPATKEELIESKKLLEEIFHD
jgi:sugar phosphate isomerase/epimerase